MTEVDDMFEHKCLEYAEKLSTIVAEDAQEHKCDCLLLSGGIDTSFIASSLDLNGLKPKAITVVFNKENSDHKFSKIISKKLGLPHKILYSSIENADQYLKIILNITRSINPIEVVCDLPTYIGLEYALEHGCKCVLTGDGGDELFLGYSFLLNLTVDKLEEWLKHIMKKAYFPAVKISKYIGLETVPGFFTKKVKIFSGDIPLECRINNYNGSRWGKFLLRLFLAEHGLNEIAWRGKTPINIGSGFNILLDEWSKRIKFNEILKLYHQSEIYFPSRVHAYLYRKMLEYDIKIPVKCSGYDKACPICGRCMYDNHCNFCGASLLDGSLVYAYSDETLNKLRGG